MRRADSSHRGRTVPAALTGLRQPPGQFVASAIRALACAFALAATLAPAAARADAPADIARTYAADAARQQPGFVPAAERGREFFTRHFTASKDFASCSTCHTDNPAVAGKHQITGKRIAPMAPAANAERFSSAAKVEKWFKRNCDEVIGRDCTAAEKADFIAYMTTVRP